MKLILKNFNEYKFCWIIIILSVSIGTLIRLKGLGTWSLALDEYYIIKSSENILTYGLPQFPNGGFYSRGILIQYLISFLLFIGIKAEFAGRIFSVIANLLTIPPIYLISKRIGNIRIATIAIVIFSFSIWEIEFARFARMYTPFQAIFMWYVYFALKDFSNKNFDNYKWLIGLSTLSFFVYEGSIFLAVFNFIPFIINRKLTLKYLFFALITFVVSVFINTFSFRTSDSNPILSQQIQDLIKGTIPSSPIKIPKILFLFGLENFVSAILTLLILGISFFFIYKIYKSLEQKNFWHISTIIFLGVFAITNQFGLFIFSLIIFVFWDLLELNSSHKILFLLGGLFFINFLYWLSFGLLSDNWFVLFDDFSSYTSWGLIKRLLVGFFNFPDNYYSLYNYFITLPILTIFTGLFSFYLIYQLIFIKAESKSVKFLFGLLIFVSLLSTIPTLMYDETRYTFFAVPLLIILLNYSVYLLLSNLFKYKKLLVDISFIIIAISTFVISNDFNLYHLMNIDEDKVNYRMIYENNYYKKHLYRRWDTKTPTDFVKNNMKKDDLIIINENSQEYYLPKVDFFSIDYSHRAFKSISIEYSTKERWSNAQLISNNIDLQKLIDNRTATTWFVVYPENYLKRIDFHNKYSKFLICQGIDHMIKVYKFPAPSEQ